MKLQADMEKNSLYIFGRLLKAHPVTTVTLRSQREQSVKIVVSSPKRKKEKMCQFPGKSPQRFAQSLPYAKRTALQD